MIERLAVIGCGLIGSSVIRAARAKGAVGSIAVHDQNPAVRERVRALGLELVEITQAPPSSPCRSGGAAR